MSSSILIVFFFVLDFFHPPVGILLPFRRRAGRFNEGKSSRLTRGSLLAPATGVWVTLRSSSARGEVCCSFSSSPDIVRKGSANQRGEEMRKERSNVKKEVIRKTQRKSTKERQCKIFGISKTFNYL